MKIKNNPARHLTGGYLPFAICYLLFLSGCATVDYIPRPAPPARAPMAPGIYHRVEKGQTLWWISKIYGVDLDEIISSNNIKDSTQIDTGQTIFIPHGSKMAANNYPIQGVTGDFIWPKNGTVISSFGNKSAGALNKGITMRVYAHSEVVASGSGTVVFTNEMLKGYGKTVIIAHSEGIMTVYALLSQIMVKPGERINQGMPIARCENGLLHFEIRKGHIPQNPYYYLPAQQFAK